MGPYHAAAKCLPHHVQQTQHVNPIPVQCWSTVAGSGHQPFWTVLFVGGGVSTEYKLTPIQCMLNVGPASQVLGSIHSALVSTSLMLWTKAGLMLARRLWRWPTFSAKHDTVARYRANVGSALYPTLAQHWINVSCSTACTIESAGEKWMRDRHRLRQTERKEVYQYVPTSVYRGET